MLFDIFLNFLYQGVAGLRSLHQNDAGLYHLTSYLVGRRGNAALQHGEFFTFYCKLGSVSVKAGQKISTGQTIGKVETINGETVLHFQLWEDRTPQDPELWLR